MRLFCFALGVGLCVPAAQAQLVVNAPLMADRVAVPGETYEGRVPVSNATDVPREARVFVTDYRYDASGTNWYGEPGSHARSSGAWLALGTDRIVVPPRSTVDVTYAVTVPASDTLGGTYWSMLMVEEVPVQAEGIETAVGIQRRVRYGIQVVTHLGSAESRLELLSVGLEAGPDGVPALQIDVGNEGDRSADTDVYVDLFDGEGASLGRVSGTRFRVYPETSVRHRVAFADVPPGTYEALVVVASRGGDAIGAQYTLDL